MSGACRPGPARARAPSSSTRPGAAAISSSGLVCPFGASARDGHDTGRGAEGAASRGGDRPAAVHQRARPGDDAVRSVAIRSSPSNRVVELNLRARDRRSVVNGQPASAPSRMPRRATSSSIPAPPLAPGAATSTIRCPFPSTSSMTIVQRTRRASRAGSRRSRARRQVPSRSTRRERLRGAPRGSSSPRDSRFGSGTSTEAPRRRPRSRP